MREGDMDLKRKAATKFYVCNRKRCKVCTGEWCRHTTDIEYALYEDHPDDMFDCITSKDFGSQLWERMRRG